MYCLFLMSVFIYLIRLLYWMYLDLFEENIFFFRIVEKKEGEFKKISIIIEIKFVIFVKGDILGW